MLRGPSALLFGSSAIGGVVNVIDTRIPRSVPDEPVDVDALLQYGSAANERSANLSVDVPLGGHFVAHVDGAYSKFDDLDIGGYLLSEAAARAGARQPRSGHPRAGRSEGQAAQHGGPHRRRRRRRSPTSTATSTSAFRSATTTSNTAFRSASRSIPTSRPKRRPSTARQTRGDAARRTCRSAASSRCSSSAAASPNIITTKSRTTARSARASSRNGGEMRADLVQTERGGWGGTSGVQYLDQQRAHPRRREISARQHATGSSACSRCSRWSRGKVRFEAGARIEFAKLHADEDAADRGERRHRRARIGRSSPQLHAGLRLARRELRVRRRAGARACRCRTASARPRSTNCSPTGRTAAASSS